MNETPLFSYIQNAPTPYHAAEESYAILSKAGFASWNGLSPLRMGGRYLYPLEDGLTVAFVMPSQDIMGARLVASHNDSPCFRLKPSPCIKREGYTLLNAECYGGPVLSSWLDRPLAVAGLVYTPGKTWDKPHAHLVTLPKRVTIPSLAAHMHREEGALNAQSEMLALWGSEAAPSFEATLAGLLGVSEGDILSHELYLVSDEGFSFVGDEGIVSGPRLDNLVSAYAGTLAIASAAPRHHIALFVSYNHEEIGSRSPSGAQSAQLRALLDTIYAAAGLATKPDELLLSMDGAHSVHPSYPQKADPVLRPVMGRGVVLKLAASHAYATTGRGEAIFRALCASAKLPYQTFANRADMRGGSTIGPLAETANTLPAIDCGIPMLSMHSIRETAHLSDIQDLTTLAQAFMRD